MNAARRNELERLRKLVANGAPGSSLLLPDLIALEREDALLSTCEAETLAEMARGPWTCKAGTPARRRALVLHRRGLAERDPSSAARFRPTQQGYDTLERLRNLGWLSRDPQRSEIYVIGG